MKKTNSAGARRIGVAQAKAELSQEIKNAAEAPTIIHNRGRDVAVLLGIDEYARLTTLEQSAASSMVAFLNDVEVLKSRHGGGVDFEPPRLSYLARDPFESVRKRRSR